MILDPVRDEASDKQAEKHHLTKAEKMNTLTESTETRYDAAVATIRSQAVTFTDPNTAYGIGIGKIEAPAPTKEFAYTTYKNWEEDLHEGAITTVWVYGTLHIGASFPIENRCEDCDYDTETDRAIHTERPGCEESGLFDEESRDEIWDVMKISFSTIETGNIINAAFTEQGFDVDWDGTIDNAIRVTI